MLTNEEFGSVQATIEEALEELASQSLSMHVSRDFESFVALRRSFGHDHLNQAFTPDHTRFGADDFWLRVDNAEGEAIATHAVRIVETADFLDLVRTMHLWFNKRPVRLADPGYRVLDALEPFGGVVSHGGGMWVNPRYRGHGLSSVLPRFARAMALRKAAIDHDTGMMLDGVAPTRLATRNYGFARVGLIVDGWFPPEGRDVKLYLGHLNRGEVLAGIRPVERLAA